MKIGVLSFKEIQALLNKIYPTQIFPFHRGFVIDDVRVVLDGLGCQASKASVPQRGWHPNTTRICSHFTHDQDFVLVHLAMDGQGSASGHRGLEAIAQESGWVRLS